MYLVSGGVYKNGVRDLFFIEPNHCSNFFFMLSMLLCGEVCVYEHCIQVT